MVVWKGGVASGGVEGVADGRCGKSLDGSEGGATRVTRMRVVDRVTGCRG